MTTELDPPNPPDAQHAADAPGAPDAPDAPDAPESVADDTGDTGDQEICQLAADVEVRLATISSGTALPLDALRRKLLTRLSRSERRAAAERRSLRARKYVEQRGRCPLCGEQLELGRGRDVLPVDAHKPLACLACVRAQAPAQRKGLS